MCRVSSANTKRLFPHAGKDACWGVGPWTGTGTQSAKFPREEACGRGLSLKPSSRLIAGQIHCGVNYWALGLWPEDGVAAQTVNTTYSAFCFLFTVCFSLLVIHRMSVTCSRAQLGAERKGKKRRKKKRTVIQLEFVRVHYLHAHADEILQTCLET